MDRTHQIRQFFAHLVTANAGVPAGSELETAFASTPREQFVGPPPWRVFTPRGYIETASDDPSVLYQDDCSVLSEIRESPGRTYCGHYDVRSRI